MEHGIRQKDFACISSCQCYSTVSMPTVCLFRCTNRRQHPTSGSRRQTSSLRRACTASTLQRHANLTCCNTCRKQSVLGDVTISFAQHYF